MIDQLTELLTYIGLYLNTLMMGLWVFVLGACIGSFLNVVIYRLPAGMALSHPGSRCPFCETELAARDNIPILGWVFLRGKCRYCSVPIAARYPLIESLVGLAFLILFMVETNQGATNLPFVPMNPMRFGAFDALIRLGQWELPAWFVVHAFYLTTVLAICMIAVDGHHTPVRLTVFGLVMGIVVGCVWPAMRPVQSLQPMPSALDQYWGFHWQAPAWLGNRFMTTGVGTVGLIDGLAGVASGLVAGILAGRAAGPGTPADSALRNVLLLTGVTCGWQMTWPLLAVMLLATSLLTALSPSIRNAAIPLLLFAASSGLLLYWDTALNGIFLIRHDGWRWTSAGATVDWAVTIAVLTALAILLSVARRPASDTAA